MTLQANFFQDYMEFAEALGYETNYEKALQKAQKEHKKLFVFYMKGGCPYCHKMIDEVLTEKYVRTYINQNFVKLILHREDSPEIPKQFRRLFAPISFIVDPKTGKIEKEILGYMDPEQYLWQF